MVQLAKDRFVPVLINGDQAQMIVNAKPDSSEALEAQEKLDAIGTFKIRKYPTVVFTDPAGNTLERFVGPQSSEKLLELMQGVLAKLKE